MACYKEKYHSENPKLFVGQNSEDGDKFLIASKSYNLKLSKEEFLCLREALNAVSH